MPGPEATYTPPPGTPDLYPVDETAHAELLGECMQAFTAADSARRSKEDKWRKYHRAYRNWVDRTSGASGWRSAVPIPYVFSIIENLVPRMVAQLPWFTAMPVGPEDVIPAKAMELKLRYSAERVNLHLELILAIKSALKFGTGIVKTFYAQEFSKAYEMVPMVREVLLSEPELAPDGSPVTDMDGNTQMTQVPTQEPVLDEMGNPVMVAEPYEYLKYQGPSASWVDIFNFWPAPDATDIQGARYVIQRSYRELSELQDLIDAGVYRLPSHISTIDELFTSEEESGKEIRESEIGEDGDSDDTTRRPVELLEFWFRSSNRVVTIANRTAVIRSQENPFWHGEKPFVRFVDYLLEGEFWGAGEAEAVEGLQDLANALVNQRIDNVRLTMDRMFAVNTKALEDERDLVVRPGAIVRVSGDYLPSEAIMPLDLGDVNSSAFEEAAEVERLIERTSGVSDFTLGTEEEGVNRTATGVSLMTESGNTKVALKVKQMELMALLPLARHWGSIVQQFTEEEEFIRLLGPNGQWLFATITPEGVQGALDYTIETMSSTQTETVAKEQAMTLLQTVSGVMPQAVPQLVKDTLEAFGKKNLLPYFTGMPDLELMQQMMMTDEFGNIIPFPQNQAVMGQVPGPGAAGSQQGASDQAAEEQP
jgi:hypothetical protein